MDVAIEEDGDEIFTPMPKQCTQWRDDPRRGYVRCAGEVAVRRGHAGGFFHICGICAVSYGPAVKD